MSEQSNISKLKREVDIDGKGPFVLMEKDYFDQLMDALQAVVEGENDLKEGNTREFEDFIKEEFSDEA